MWPINMYFAQIYILAEMSYGKTSPDLGTYVQLNNHARPYVLSICHSGWRWVLSYSSTDIVFYWRYIWTFQEPGTVPHPSVYWYRHRQWFLDASDLSPVSKCLKYGSKSIRSSLLAAHDKVLITTGRRLIRSPKTAWGHHPITTQQGALS